MDRMEERERPATRWRGWRRGIRSFSENARAQLTTGRLHSLLADGSGYER
jgi:hypothetical protein